MSWKVILSKKAVKDARKLKSAGLKNQTESLLKVLQGIHLRRHHRLKNSSATSTFDSVLCCFAPLPSICLVVFLMASKMSLANFSHFSGQKLSLSSFLDSA